jgi:hypothetical protein
VGTRRDVSDYVMDFNYGSLYTQGIFIGIGVSELGYQSNKSSLWEYISNGVFNAPYASYPYNKGNHYYIIDDKVRTFEQFRETGKRKVTDLKNQYRDALIPNAVFVFDGSGGRKKNDINDDTAFEFILEQLEFGFLYLRGDFTY